MTRTPPASLSARHHLAQICAREQVDADALHRRTGIPRARCAELLEDPRQLPAPRELLAVGMALDVLPDEVLAWDPVPDLMERAWDRDTAAEPVQVTICGAGNLGHVFAALLSARPDVRVRWLTSSPGRAQNLHDAQLSAGGILVEHADGSTTRGRPVSTFSDPAEAVDTAEVVLLCMPSFREPPALEALAEHLPPGATIVSIPATGGIQWSAPALLGRQDLELVGLAAIPWMCKVAQWGQRVRVLGTKAVESAAFSPRERAPALLEQIASLIHIPTLPLGSFLPIILNPGNQMLHTGILWAMFRDWDGAPLPEAPLFYEGISQEGADAVAAIDEEMRAIGAALATHHPTLDLSAVLPVQVAIMAAYGAEIEDASSLRAVISTNRAYAGIRTPMVEVDGGRAPDWNSRFLLEDIPYGLVLIRGLATLLEVSTPTIDTIIRWAQERMGRTYLTEDGLDGPDLAHSGAPQRHGISSPDELVVS